MIPRLPFIIALFLIGWMMLQMEKKDTLHERHAFLEKEYERLSEMQHRIDKYTQEHERTCQRIMELSEKPDPTAEEVQELAWMKAAQIEP